MSDMTRHQPNAVDDTRKARDEVSARGFASLREHLRRVREEHRARTGPFADIPKERPDDVREIIDAATVDSPMVDELRRSRGVFGEN